MCIIILVKTMTVPYSSCCLPSWSEELSALHYFIPCCVSHLQEPSQGMHSWQHKYDCQLTVTVIIALQRVRLWTTGHKDARDS